MPQTLLLAVAMTLLAVLPARAQAPELGAEKAELLRLLAQDRRAHFETSVDLLMERTPDTMISVSNGAVRRIAKADFRQMFVGVFRGATYQEWEPIEEPIVRISNDASMAWIITRLRVRRLKTQDDGNGQLESFTYAGIMTYEKRNGRWMKVANVSTFE